MTNGKVYLAYTIKGQPFPCLPSERILISYDPKSSWTATKQAQHFDFLTTYFTI